MPEREKAPIVLVAASQDTLRSIRDALTDTNLALLHAKTKDEAIAVLKRLKFKIDLAIVELEFSNFDSWDLIRRLKGLSENPVKIIATTSMYPEPFFGKIKATGVDAVVPIAIPPEKWRKTVEAVLKNGKPSDCDTPPNPHSGPVAL